MSPPMWFLGAYEVAVGGVIADLPRTEMRPRQAATDLAMSALYRERRPEFPAMARRAAARHRRGVARRRGRLPVERAGASPSLAAAPPPASRRGWRSGARLANAWLVRDPAARAGFYFTLAAMWRSNNHRLTLVCAAAAGFAMALVALSNANAQRGRRPVGAAAGDAAAAVWRIARRVPARDPRAGGAARQLGLSAGLARSQPARSSPACRRAAIVGLVLPALAILLPFFMFVMGPPLALMHAGLGLAGAIVLLEALMVSYDKVPFTCTYLPSENMKALAPIYAIAFVIGAVNFARMQNRALQSGNPARVLITLAVAFAILRVMSMKRARLPHVEFDEAPAQHYQHLGLQFS